MVTPNILFKRRALFPVSPKIHRNQRSNSDSNGFNPSPYMAPDFSSIGHPSRSRTGCQILRDVVSLRQMPYSSYGIANNQLVEARLLKPDFSLTSPGPQLQILWETQVYPDGQPVEG
jgi:hypothetical protein